VNIVQSLSSITLVGAFVGVFACFSPWVGDITGVDLFNSYGGSFQVFIPFFIIGLSAVSALLSVLMLTRTDYWYIPFIQFFIGVAVMILTSVFSMWSIDSVKVTSMVSMGFWISYLAGILMILGGALQHALIFGIIRLSR